LVSAPVGSAKSSFEIAFLAAVARTYPEFGCLLAVDQIDRADMHAVKPVVKPLIALQNMRQPRCRMELPSASTADKPGRRSLIYH
jgi:hypothetical protein